MIRPLLFSLVLLTSASCLAQDFGNKAAAASVSFQPPDVSTMVRGKANSVKLQFRIASGFHINSNLPRQDYLKKTELKLDPPTDVAIGKLTYPAGEDRSFPFAPDDKLSVYTGDFAIGVTVHPLKTVVPATYAVHGTLKYQACDNAACYPPKQLPVSFEVKVVKSTAEHIRRNPGQSPRR